MESPPRHVLGLKAQVLTETCCKAARIVGAGHESMIES